MGLTANNRHLEAQAIPPEVQQRFRQLRVMGRFSRDPAAVRRILVRVPNWVGDAVMSLPVLSGLRGFFPQAAITILAASRVAPLFQDQPGVLEIVPYPRNRNRWQVLWRLRHRFDLALALPNSLESAAGLWLAGAPVRAGYRADARGPLLTLAVSGRRRLAGVHTVYYYLGVLTAFGVVSSFSPPALSLEPRETAAAAALLAAAAVPGDGPWVGLSPGAAYGPAKRWPPERVAALGTELVRAWGARLVLLGGPDERPVADLVQAHLHLPVLDLVGRTELRQALGVLTQLKLLITNDSGLMHAAAALQVPLLALFGSTDPAATGPFTARATVLRHLLPCSPCFQRTCAIGYPCLTAITVDEVMAAARQWLE